MNEFQIQKQMVQEMKTVTLRLWGAWNGESTRPRFVCNNSLQHQFADTVEACAEREAETGFACPICVELREEHTVDFDTFSKDAIAVNKSRKKSEEKALAKAGRSRGHRFGLDSFAI